jgi:hypothetical protein
LFSMKAQILLRLYTYALLLAWVNDENAMNLKSRDIHGTTTWN